jgi:hypothetical protein
MGVSGWKMMALPRRDWHRRGPCVALAVGRQARLVAEVRASDAEAMIVHLKLLIAKVRHERFGAFSEVMEPTQGLTPLLTPGGRGIKTGRQLDRVGEGAI